MIPKFRSINGSNKLAYYDFATAPANTTNSELYASSGTVAIYMPSPFANVFRITNPSLNGSGVTTTPFNTTYPLASLGVFSYVNNRFVHLYTTNAGASGTGIVAVSTDNGQTFTRTPVPALNSFTARGLSDIVFFENKYVFLGASATSVPTMFSSTDLITWNTTATSPQVQINHPVIFKGSLYGSLDNPTRLYKYISVLGLWNLVYTGETGFGHKKLYVNGDKIFYVSSTNNIVSSTDGETWSSTPITADVAFPTPISAVVITRQVEAFQFGPRLFIRPNGTTGQFRQVPIPAGSNQNLVSPISCLQFGTGIVGMGAFSGVFKYLP